METFGRCRAKPFCTVKGSHLVLNRSHSQAQNCSHLLPKKYICWLKSFTFGTKQVTFAAPYGSHSVAKYSHLIPICSYLYPKQFTFVFARSPTLDTYVNIFVHICGQKCSHFEAFWFTFYGTCVHTCYHMVHIYHFLPQNVNRMPDNVKHAILVCYVARMQCLAQMGLGLCMMRVCYCYARPRPESTEMPAFLFGTPQVPIRVLYSGRFWAGRRPVCSHSCKIRQGMIHFKHSLEVSTCHSSFNYKQRSKCDDLKCNRPDL